MRRKSFSAKMNAVAKSAALRKAQEFKERENVIRIEKDNIMNEAVNAVQSVMSAARITSSLRSDNENNLG